MQVVYERCSGVDVHKKMIMACLRMGKQQETRTYGTSTEDLKAMAGWLISNQCQMVAMESTGSYWKPVYNVLEVLGLEAMVVNAQHMKAVPGKKTDVKDAEWIADLLQHGLLKASYIPDKDQRELREVSRYRKSLVEERAREINRLEKALEGGNVKLSSFVTDLTGVSSRNMLTALMTEEGVNGENIDGMLYGKLRGKREELVRACDGVLSRVQKKLIRAIISHIDDMTARIKEMDDIIKSEMDKYEAAIKALDAIPGIGEYSAQTILSEIGLDMGRFPSAAHLCSWAGICPGNNESAGKRKSGRTCPGNKTLKTTLVQCATTASRKKGSFLKAQFDRLVPRKGKNRATVAVAHSILIAIYHVLNNGVEYRDLGEDYYNKDDARKKIAYHTKQLKKLGVPLPHTATA